MISQTSQQYDQAIAGCREIFLKKNKDYGTSWRIMRMSSITDQIFIKAQRIRTLEQSGEKKIDEDVDAEYQGILNYCIIGLIQTRLQDDDNNELATEQLAELYDEEIAVTKQLMENKNQDYGEAWRSMRISTYTDMLLMRIFRMKQIEDNQGNTLVSEGVDSNLRDMINYCVFALIRLNENYETHRTD